MQEPGLFRAPIKERQSKMAEEAKLWRIDAGSALREIPRSRLDLESRLEGWLEKDISILDPELLVVGRQVQTIGGPIDLLCLSRSGDLVVVELKRDKTPREVTAQALDYGSWAKDVSAERITEIAAEYLHGPLDETFARRFSEELPETLGEKHRLLIVGSEIDPRSERIIRYLSGTFGVNINAATFRYFKEPDGRELLARVFLIDPTQVEQQNRTKGGSKRPPRSSIGFAGTFADSRKNILSLIPQESTAADGLRFQVYFQRLRSLLGIPEDAALSLLPMRREPWTFYEAGGPDYSGFQGYFADRTDVDRLVSALAGSRTAPNQGR